MSLPAAGLGQEMRVEKRGGWERLDWPLTVKNKREGLETRNWFWGPRGNIYCPLPPLILGRRGCWTHIPEAGECSYIESNTFFLPEVSEGWEFTGVTHVWGVRRAVRLFSGVKKMGAPLIPGPGALNDH